MKELNEQAAELNGSIATNGSVYHLTKGETAQNGSGVSTKNESIVDKPWERMNGYPYETIEEISRLLTEKTSHRPKIGIICGSGLGTLADSLVQPTIISYDEIPYFPPSTVPGHAGRIVIGLLDGVPVLAMKGRLHLYEGYPLWLCAMPVRVMKLLGIEKIVITCAAGGLNPAYRVGDIMVMKDHINLQGFTGNSPLVGIHDERFGPRFFPTNKTYDKQYRETAKRIATEMGIADSVREGVHVMMGGPAYETIAELRFLRMVGVDSVGMSTIHEVLVARQCGMRVFAFSLITNECVTDYDCHMEANHEEVLETAEQRQGVLKEFVRRMVKEMIKSGDEDDDGLAHQNGTGASDCIQNQS